MRNLHNDGWIKVLTGRSTIEEVVRQSRRDVCS